MKLRSLIFWPHLVAGVCAGLVILLMSVTGVLLMYERQLIAWSDRHFVSTPRPGDEPLPLETLVAHFQAAYPDLSPMGVTVRSAPDAPVAFAVPQRIIYFDSYSGALLGEGTQTVRRLMADLRAWHRWLAMEGDDRPLARAITGWSNVVFLFIVLSGIYLWLPRKRTWNHFKSVLMFGGRLTGKARDFNWHHVIGIWSAVPLAIVVASAVPISFPWGNALVYRMVGEDVPRPAGGGAGGGETRGNGARRTFSAAGLNELWPMATQHVPGWRSINVRLPIRPDAPVIFAIDRGDGGQPQLRSTLTLDLATGAVVTSGSFADLTPGRRIRNVMRFAHTGEVLGLPGQTIAGIASGGAVVLVWTGLALAWRRFLAAARRRAARSISLPAGPVSIALRPENQQ